MSNIDLEKVSKLEKLSMLRLSDAEKSELLVDLNNLVGMINSLAEIDTSGLEPLKHINDHSQVLRDDTLKPALDRDLALGNAPKSAGHFFTVPKVIKT